MAKEGRGFKKQSCLNFKIKMTHDKYSYTKYNNQFQRRSYVGSLQKELVHLNRGAAIASMISLLRSANTGSFLLIFFAKVIDGQT